VVGRTFPDGLRQRVTGVTQVVAVVVVVVAPDPNGICNLMDGWMDGACWPNVHGRFHRMEN
jgi:hypothetical protein